MTTWVLVGMLFAADGSKHYQQIGEPYTGPDATMNCFDTARAVSQQWAEQHRGWALCLPQDAVAGLR